MPDVKTIKATLMHAAYVGASAMFANEPPVAEDATFQDPGLRKRAVLIYEEAKIQYSAIVAAWQDNTVWPDPVVPAVTPPTTPTGAIALPGQDVGANLGKVLAGAANVAGAVAKAAGV